MNAKNEGLIVGVEVWGPNGFLLHIYQMNYDDSVQRHVLGEQCRNAFEGGQRIVTYPMKAAA